MTWPDVYFYFLLPAEVKAERSAFWVKKEKGRGVGEVRWGGGYGLQNSLCECALSSYLYFCGSTLIFCSLGQKKEEEEEEKAAVTMAT